MLEDQNKMISEETSDSSSPAWIPIDDSRGIWTEFRQGTSVHTDERQQNQQKREETLPIQNNNRPEFLHDVAMMMMTPTIPQHSSSLLLEDSATIDTKRQKLNETQDSSPAPQAASSPTRSQRAGYFRRNSSGSLWTGIQEGAENSILEVPALISNDDDDDADDDHVLESSQSSDDEWTPNESLGPAHQDHGTRTTQSSLLDHHHHGRTVISKGDPLASSSSNPLQALSRIMSLDFLFGCISTSPSAEERSREMLGLRNNVNAEIALGLVLDQEEKEKEQEDNRAGIVIISSAAIANRESHLSRLGYSPGMQVVKVNGDPVASCSPNNMSSLLEEVYSKMELKIQVMDDLTRVTKEAVLTVHEPKLHLYVHKKRSKQSKDMYITKVEPNSAFHRAGFQPGMRLIRVNDKPCPTTFMGLANLLTADVVAIPKDLMVPIGGFWKSQRTISNLSLPHDVVDEQRILVERRSSPNCQSNSSSSPLLDLQKSFWLHGGGGGGRLMMITAR